MVDILQGDEVSAYADFDSRSLARNTKRVALANLPTIDLSSFTDGGTHEDRTKTARAIRAACIDIGFSILSGTASRQAN